MRKRKPRKKPSQIFTPKIYGAFLTTREVAALEGVSELHVSHWCREDWIFPAVSVSGRWRIGCDYIVSPGARGKVYEGVPPGPGRPLGAKNKRPYQKGVKRPRKPAPQSTSPSQ